MHGFWSLARKVCPIFCRSRTKLCPDFGRSRAKVCPIPFAPCPFPNLAGTLLNKLKTTYRTKFWYQKVPNQLWYRPSAALYRLLVTNLPATETTHLHAMNRQAWSGVQFLMANMTLKMFCFLVLDQNLFVIKFSIAVPDKCR